MMRDLEGDETRRREMCVQPAVPVVPDSEASSSCTDGRSSESPKLTMVDSTSNARAPRLRLKPSAKPLNQTRCARCGSKWHASWKCAQTVRKCARCSDPTNTQQCHTVVMRTRLMKTVRSRGDHRQVQTILTTLRKDGHHPAKESYTLLLSSLIASGRIHEGLSLVQQMNEDKVVPDAIFFNTLLNGYCEAGDMEEAEALFKQMKETGCIPITSTFNTLIKGYGLAGKPEGAMKLLQEMGKEEDSKPNDRTFNMLINVWARQNNPQEARYVMSLMRAGGIAPDVVSYNTLVQVYARIGKPWEALRVIMEMQNAYLRPNERTYGIVINGFIAAGKIEDSIPLIERMRSEGIRPNVSIFNHLIKGYAEAMQADGIDKVFEMMKSCSVKPDHQTFGLIMNAWCNTGYVDEAKAAVERMNEYDLQPDVTAYSILAKGYARGGRPEEGEALLKIMTNQNVTPNVVTYTTVISGYCSLAQMDDAMRVFKEMKMRGISPSMNTFHTLIWGYNEARWPRRAAEVLQLMKKSGITPDIKCLDLVAECWRSVGLSPEGENLPLGKDIDEPDGEITLSDAGQNRSSVSSFSTALAVIPSAASGWPGFSADHSLRLKGIPILTMTTHSFAGSCSGYKRLCRSQSPRITTFQTSRAACCPRYYITGLPHIELLNYHLLCKSKGLETRQSRVYHSMVDGCRSMSEVICLTFPGCANAFLMW